MPSLYARPAAEEFEAQPNALVLCFIYSGDKSGFLFGRCFFYMFYTNVCIPQLPVRISRTFGEDRPHWQIYAEESGLKENALVLCFVYPAEKSED